MKKVLALVLAVMMMATVAFASTTVTNPQNPDVANTPKNYVPGDKIKFNDSGVQALLDAAGDTTTVVKSINSTNYSIAKVEWKEGRNLVESVKFDDANDNVTIKLKQDYTLTTRKELYGEINLKGKKVGKGTRPDDLVIKIGTQANPITVGYTLADGKDATVGKPAIKITSNNDAIPDFGTTGVTSFDDDTNNADIYLWKVIKASGSDEKQGLLEFTAADGDTDVEVRVYDGDKLYLFNNVDADTDILKANADADADITFLSFPGAPTFNSTATVRFYKEEDSYVYGMKDGKLTNVNAKWDDDEGCFILKTRTLGSYVFSDKKLNVSASTAADNNPDTGANDVVGIATALAAVALVSAAAVSLKK